MTPDISTCPTDILVDRLHSACRKGNLAEARRCADELARPSRAKSHVVGARPVSEWLMLRGYSPAQLQPLQDRIDAYNRQCVR